MTGPPYLYRSVAATRQRPRIREVISAIVATAPGVQQVLVVRHLSVGGIADVAVDAVLVVGFEAADPQHVDEHVQPAVAGPGRDVDEYSRRERMWLSYGALPV